MQILVIPYILELVISIPFNVCMTYLYFGMLLIHMQEYDAYTMYIIHTLHTYQTHSLFSHSNIEEYLYLFDT